MTAYLTGKASFKAAEVLAEQDLGARLMNETVDTRDKVQAVWKLYIPAAGTLVATIVCLVGANQIGTRRAAAMAAAFSLSDKAFEEYRKKVVEKIGEKKEQGFRDELAQDSVREDPVVTREVIITGGGDVLCRDQFSGRYFTSDMESLKSAVNDVNHEVLNNYYASLTDFYNKIGLPRTSISDDVGWNSNKLLELEFSTAVTEDGRPCLTVGFRVEPIRDYYRLN
jgi:hypothetical protein